MIVAKLHLFAAQKLSVAKRAKIYKNEIQNIREIELKSFRDDHFAIIKIILVESMSYH